MSKIDINTRNRQQHIYIRYFYGQLNLNQLLNKVYCITCFMLTLAGEKSTMGSAVERTDEHVREYLIYRGFTSTLKHLDSDIKTDKEKGFRVQRENMEL